MAKKKIYDLTRKEYEKVKKLDHDGMRQHLEKGISGRICRWNQGKSI